MATTLQSHNMTDASLYPGMDTAAVNAASSGDNTLVSAVAGKKVYVYGLLLVIGGASNLTFKDGASTSLSGALPMLANGAILLDRSNLPWYQTAAGNAFILNSSNAVQLSGTIYYRQV